MTKRRIVLPDGRYLIYYSFDDQVLPHPDSRAEAAKARVKKPGTPHEAPQRRKAGQ
jgi:hypothetical protein